MIPLVQATTFLKLTDVLQHRWEGSLPGVLCKWRIAMRVDLMAKALTVSVLVVSLLVLLSCTEERRGEVDLITQLEPSKEAIVTLLREFHQALEESDYERAKDLVQPFPHISDAEMIKRLPRLAREVTATGIEILAARGKFGKLLDVFPRRGENFANKAGVDAEECFALSFRPAEVAVYWGGDRPRLIRVDDIGKLEAVGGLEDVGTLEWDLERENGSDNRETVLGYELQYRPGFRESPSERQAISRILQVRVSSLFESFDVSLDFAAAPDPQGFAVRIGRPMGPAARSGLQALIEMTGQVSIGRPALRSQDPDWIAMVQREQEDWVAKCDASRASGDPFPPQPSRRVVTDAAEGTSFVVETTTDGIGRGDFAVFREAKNQSGFPAIEFEMTTGGARKLKQLATQAANENLVVVVDGVAVSIVSELIRSGAGGLISPDVDVERMAVLFHVLNSGALSATPLWQTEHRAGEPRPVRMRVEWNGKIVNTWGAEVSAGAEAYQMVQGRLPKSGRKEVLLSYWTWVRFGESPGMVGDSILVNGQNARVVGVCDGSEGGGADLWVSWSH